ncbi:hypothetical protein Nepgr_030978 [Nepenthes gracilis]|uniref:Uncharacterized protein n=1 Tax=Nepenthes gracilis TaxID=150966 RepID=A0AAD3TFK4_NEPGR|nr:hypothetical protein Nepgr_030978 [Nepenthes gracilis]
MGDDRELQQTSIPIPDNESSQPSRPTAADLATENVPNASPLEHPGGDTPAPQADRESPRLNAGKIISDCNKGTAVQAARLFVRSHGRLAILLMIWLLINLRVRSLRKKIILGSQLWQWTLLIVIIFCGYSVISMVTSLVVHFFIKTWKKGYSAVYYAIGLRRSVNFTLLSILLVLTWHFYFRTHKGLRETKNTHVIFRVGKWSPICLLLLSLCWLLKTWLLLKWTAEVISKRFSERMIFDTAFQCYFLYGCILGAAAAPNSPRGGVAASPEFERQLDFMTYIKKSKEALRYVKATLRPTESPTHETRLIAYYLNRIANVWPRDLEDDATAPIREILRKRFGYLDRYKVTAHRSNLMLAFTLNDLSGVADCLDKLMSGIAIITVIILWLLLMDVTTVTKLILIASPFLSGAFIFIGSFMPMLQGIIFTLVGHPFDIGDQCIIDEVQVIH